MSKGLNIAPGLVMPLESVTGTFAVFANRGKGKSNTCTALVEEMFAADLPVVVLDVKGDWWGLRSSGDGKGPGLPFIIFGGDHADVPLEPSAGALMADLIVDERIHAVLDLSDMSKTNARSFTTAFAERLYRRNRDPLHLVVDEADVLIPQRASAETARLLGAMEDIAKRGRHRGLGMTIATQRVQDVATPVRDLMETLIIGCTTGYRAVMALKDWISVHADENTTAAEVIASLPSLKVGETWVWSPSFLGILERVQMRRATTFDSHATPKPGQVRQQPKGRADVDLAALGVRIAATVEKAKADDPRALRAKIAELERQLAARPHTVEVERIEVPVRVDVPALSDQTIATIRDVAGTVQNAAQVIADAVAKVTAAAEPKPEPARNTRVTPAPATLPRAGRDAETAALRARHAAEQADLDAHLTRTDARNTRVNPAPSSLSKAQRAVLTALAQYHPTTRNRNQVALLSHYSSRSGNFSNTLSSLRTAEFITGSGALAITDAGLDALGPFDALPSGEALRDYWCTNESLLGKAHRMILAALIEVYPDGLDRDKIGEVTGYSAASGNFSNALSKLRSLELIDRGNPIRASADLFT